MTLSERIASATELTDELHEECAIALGWKYDCELPKLDVAEMVAEIERKEWYHSSNSDSNGCGFVVWGDHGFYHEATRPDRNLTLAALEALLKAMGE